MKLKKSMIEVVSNFLLEEEGLTMVEYAIAGALVAAVAITGFRTLGTNVTSTASNLNGAFPTS